MITDCFDSKTPSMMSPQVFYGDRKDILDTCLILFSKEIHDHLLSQFPCQQISELRACNGNIPVYKLNYKGKEIGFYLTGIGSSMASTMCYEVSWITGAKNFIMFGSCGSMAEEKTAGKFIIPTESYRGEGTSYYYAPPADYITVKNSGKMAQIFEKMAVPHVLGRIWTTDVMLRETYGLVAARQAEGCIAVEMEVAGVQAACDFYGLELYDFLEAGDVLGAGGYEVEGLHGANHNLGKLYIALETALHL